MRGSRGVLVTDGLFRKSLAAVRALGRVGVPVTAGERVHLAPAVMSRYATRRVTYPDPILDPERFLHSLSRILAAGRVAVLLAMEETTLLAILDRRSALPPGCRLFAAPAAVIRGFSDKLASARLLASAGWPVPATSQDPATIPLPAVVKPRSGSGAHGVVRVDDREVCIREFERVRRKFREAVVQKFIPGCGVGVSLLVDRNGDASAAFAHRRLRENPASGGASTLRESIPLPPDYRDLARTLHQEGFIGPVNVEFREEAGTGTLCPIEINPRYWGSLALPIRAGVNFPLQHVRLALGEHPGPKVDYPIGVRCRWLLPGDLLSGWGHLRRGEFKKALAVLNPRGPFDILSTTDPAPTLARILAPVAWAASPGLRRLLSGRRVGD